MTIKYLDMVMVLVFGDLSKRLKLGLMGNCWSEFKTLNGDHPRRVGRIYSLELRRRRRRIRQLVVICKQSGRLKQPFWRFIGERCGRHERHDK